ncbi:DUF2977 domain-containing protein [Staphylococcus condimenti]|uniref:DUF2977 domain-containing protein n=1 Tax=Staphylococcus condimenti TaxID=70255 RepID=A0AB37H0T8_9STAP|nr:DUF2977 domain-containing protein [Staphylococcus condimenti]AMY05047.1 hypothetical protein A4G25_03505 [Staphylococcus condimenti]PNZ61218.1 DUF2977 domain-containing protein [Staphylococcus condimenti]QQS83157.1 DUF2977 domain-containing protein [Staphylococcus condimenti]QRP94408.1 DUF2977 domain-containing protein [Staphylococcus condimenti]VEG64622.1 Protein of uncharacterised function (DUF2977) [Staphylococcus condimenti]
MQLLIENDYITSYVIIGSITNGVEFDEGNLPTDFFNQFEPNKYVVNSEGKVVLSDEYEEKEDIYIPSNIEVQMAQAQMQVTKTANQLVKSQKEQAETLKELTKKRKAYATVRRTTSSNNARNR